MIARWSAAAWAHGALASGFVLWIASCAGPARNAQIQIADAVSIAANDAAPQIAGMYKSDLRGCIVDASTRLDYEVCVTKVESDWTRVRLAWDHLRTLQGEYATALEKHEASVSDYVQWLKATYCEVKYFAPVRMKEKLPDIPGLECTNEGTAK